MEDILYVYGDSLYVNLTNKCPCRCTFCIRSQKEGLGTAESLWLDHDPTAEEVLAAFGDYDLSAYQEVIFCGYGEPMCALDTLLAVCRYLRGVGGVKIRVNTNGLGHATRPGLPLCIGIATRSHRRLARARPRARIRHCLVNVKPTGRETRGSGLGTQMRVGRGKVHPRCLAR